MRYFVQRNGLLFKVSHILTQTDVFITDTESTVEAYLDLVELFDAHRQLNTVNDPSK